MAAEKKPRRRRAPSDIAVRSVVKMPLGELTRFAVKLAKADADVARHLLTLLAVELPTPITSSTSFREPSPSGHEADFDG